MEHPELEEGPLTDFSTDNDDKLNDQDLLSRFYNLQVEETFSSLDSGPTNFTPASTDIAAAKYPITQNLQDDRSNILSLNLVEDEDYGGSREKLLHGNSTGEKHRNISGIMFSPGGSEAYLFTREADENMGGHQPISSAFARSTPREIHQDVVIQNRMMTPGDQRILTGVACPPSEDFAAVWNVHNANKDDASALAAPRMLPRTPGRPWQGNPHPEIYAPTSPAASLQDYHEDSDLLLSPALSGRGGSASQYSETSSMAARRAASPSVISVASGHSNASSGAATLTGGASAGGGQSGIRKNLEWDSGADLGYVGALMPPKEAARSLSTLEKLAIGNYTNFLQQPEQEQEKRRRMLPNAANCGASTNHHHQQLEDEMRRMRLAKFAESLVKQRQFQHQHDVIREAKRLTAEIHSTNDMLKISGDPCSKFSEDGGKSQEGRKTRSSSFALSSRVPSAALGGGHQRGKGIAASGVAPPRSSSLTDLRQSIVHFRPHNHHHLLQHLGSSGSSVGHHYHPAAIDHQPSSCSSTGTVIQALNKVAALPMAWKGPEQESFLLSKESHNFQENLQGGTTSTSAATTPSSSLQNEEPSETLSKQQQEGRLESFNQQQQQVYQPPVSPGRNAILGPDDYAEDSYDRGENRHEGGAAALPNEVECKASSRVVQEKSKRVSSTPQESDTTEEDGENQQASTTRPYKRMMLPKRSVGSQTKRHVPQGRRSRASTAVVGVDHHQVFHHHHNVYGGGAASPAATTSDDDHQQAHMVEGAGGGRYLRQPGSYYNLASRSSAEPIIPRGSQEGPKDNRISKDGNPRLNFPANNNQSTLESVSAPMIGRAKSFEYFPGESFLPILQQQQENSSSYEYMPGNLLTTAAATTEEDGRQMYHRQNHHHRPGTAMETSYRMAAAAYQGSAPATVVLSGQGPPCSHRCCSGQTKPAHHVRRGGHKGTTSGSLTSNSSSSVPSSSPEEVTSTSPLKKSGETGGTEEEKDRLVLPVVEGGGSHSLASPAAVRHSSKRHQFKETHSHRKLMAAEFYKHLRDCIAYIATPSSTPGDCRQKQEVAELILRNLSVEERRMQMTEDIISSNEVSLSSTREEHDGKRIIEEEKAQVVVPSEASSLSSSTVNQAKVGEVDSSGLAIPGQEGGVIDDIEIHKLRIEQMKKLRKEIRKLEKLECIRLNKAVVLSGGSVVEPSALETSNRELLRQIKECSSFDSLVTSVADDEATNDPPRRDLTLSSSAATSKNEEDTTALVVQAEEGHQKQKLAASATATAMASTTASSNSATTNNSAKKISAACPTSAAASVGVQVGSNEYHRPNNQRGSSGRASKPLKDRHRRRGGSFAFYIPLKGNQFPIKIGQKTLKPTFSEEGLSKRDRENLANFMAGKGLMGPIRNEAKETTAEDKADWPADGLLLTDSTIYTSLQEALIEKMPKFVEKSKYRVQVLKQIKAERIALSEERRQILLQAPANANCCDLISLPKVKTRRLFDYRKMVLETRRKYLQLPEVVTARRNFQTQTVYRTNRLMANIYKKQLKERVLQGKLNIVHHVNIIS